MILLEFIDGYYYSESEEWLFTIIGFLFLYFIAWAFNKYQQNNWPKEGKKWQPLPNKIVFDAINSIWDDKTFIDEFRYILYDEGNIDVFTKIIELEHSRGYTWAYINEDSSELHPIKIRIIERVINTKQYKNQILKYNLNDKDIDDFKKLFMYIISIRSFRHSIKEFIIKQKEIKQGEDVLKIDYMSNFYTSNSLKINPWEILGPFGSN